MQEKMLLNVSSDQNNDSFTFTEDHVVDDNVVEGDDECIFFAGSTESPT